MLPQTILDVINITKALGFHYLCVGALCISQDHAEPATRKDMDQESARMDQVYKNAAITIIAACALSVTDGFLKDRSTSVHRHFSNPCRRDHARFFVAHMHEHTMYDDRSEPINRRAWTYQE